MSKLIRWFAENHVAANLMMITILVGGMISIPGINRLLFPIINPGLYQINIPYPGGGPQEIEDRILIPVEEAVHDIEGVDRVISRAREGIGWIDIFTEIDLDDTEKQRVINEIKLRIDAINTFPREAENPQVREIQFREQALSIAITGDMGEAVALKIAQEIEDEVSRLPGIPMTRMQGAREPELAIEVSEFALRKFGLSFDDVVSAIKRSSVNLPSGVVKAAGGDVELKARGQAYVGTDFEEIVVLRGDDGTKVHIKDVANVIDGFQEANFVARFNGVSTILVDVQQGEGADIIDISRVVHEYVEMKNKELPEGVELTIWMDFSIAFGERMSTLAFNALGGLVLVFLVLFLFLRPVIAFWVTVGIAVSFMGTMWMFPFTGLSLNMISTFAFLLVLGIVVDDAIIIGESVHLAQEEGLRGREAAIFGAQRVSKPIIFAGATTIIAFIPMLFFPGESAKMTMAIPIVVTLTLMFSLFECLFILPHHLSGMKPLEEPRNKVSRAIRNFQQWFALNLTWVARTWYKPFMEICLKHRYSTTAAFIMLLTIAFTLMSTGRVRSDFQPSFNLDFLQVEILVPEGLAFEQSEALLVQLEGAAFTLKAELNEEYPEFDGEILTNVVSFAGRNQINLAIAFQNLDNAGLDIAKLSDRWRTHAGHLPDVLELNTRFSANDGGQDVLVFLSSGDPDALDAGVEAARAQLATYAGAYDISDLKRGGRPELTLKMKPNAEAMSVTLADVARQVRQGFYGEEVQRIPRGRDNVRVMVRYPLEERRSIDNLTDMYIRTPSGQEVPFDSVAEAEYGTGYAYIRREHRERTNYVWASLTEDGMTADEITKDLKENYFKKWEAEFPGLNVGTGGFQEEQAEFMEAFARMGFMTIIAIYILMAIAFRSYAQPLIILTAVPFGFMGAIFGHLIYDMNFSIMSYLGFVAAAGVVVNDNLVLVDFINRLRLEGKDDFESIREGAVSRFRPIVLTSVTTFIGLYPMMSLTGLQAAFLTDMVVSLAFGVLFATAVTLLLVPSLIGIGHDFTVRRRALWAWYKQSWSDKPVVVAGE
jgi:multidrug efflux pump subunit AcrB